MLRTAGLNKIRVTVTDSICAHPIAGAAVEITNSATGDTVAQGATASDGTPIVQYRVCRVADPEQKKITVVPCDGTLSLTSYPSADIRGSVS